MNEEKLKSKWGGARPGAGRPKIEKPKKMHSFRLSDEELKAVKEVLAKMRNKVILLFCLFIIGLPTLAEPLKATISYSEEDARIEAFEGVRTLSIQHSIGWDDPKYFFDLKTQNDVYAIQKTTAKYMKLFPYNMYDVVYKDELNKSYTYEKENGRYILLATETVESIKNGVIRTLKYDRYGHLLSVSLYINADKEEAFVFDKDKKPIAHWVGDKGHEITTKTKLSRELIYSAQ